MITGIAVRGALLPDDMPALHAWLLCRGFAGLPYSSYVKGGCDLHLIHMSTELIQSKYGNMNTWASLAAFMGDTV